MLERKNTFERTHVLKMELHMVDDSLQSLHKLLQKHSKMNFTHLKHPGKFKCPSLI